MYSRKMFQSSKRRVVEVTWKRCCDLAWKASRRSLHRDHTSVLARDVQGANATPNRAKRAPGCTSEKKMTSSIAREFPMFRNISKRVEDVRVHKREKIRLHKRPPCCECLACTERKHLNYIQNPSRNRTSDTCMSNGISLVSKNSQGTQRTVLEDEFVHLLTEFNVDFRLWFLLHLDLIRLGFFVSLSIFATWDV